MNENIKLLIVDDEADYRETYRMLLESRGFIVGEADSAEAALDILAKEYYPIVLTDVIMPGRDGLYLLEQIKSQYGNTVEVIVVTGYGSIDNAVKAMRIGALGYFIKSRNPGELFSEIEKARRVVRLESRKNLADRQAGGTLYLHQSESPRIRRILEDMAALSDSDCNVLITGESGVGKEIFAKHLHDKSVRSEGIFMPTNCQAFSESLLESELFGHEKGAFTGAAGRRIGRFEEASGGTLFLDEVGELSPGTQVKLLRVLDSRRIERIGSNKSIPVDFRLVSATNRILRKEIGNGRFREDLFYRINTVAFEIPPLRERREDLPGMIDFFVEQIGREVKKEIKGPAPETLRYLLAHDYPGNVRELRNLLERMIVLSRDGVLRLEEAAGGSVGTREASLEPLIPYRDAKRRFEKRYFAEALEHAGGNVTHAAKATGLSRRQFFNKITEYGLK